MFKYGPRQEPETMVSTEALMESTNVCMYVNHQHSQPSMPWAQPSSSAYPDCALLLPRAALSPHPTVGCPSMGLLGVC